MNIFTKSTLGLAVLLAVTTFRLQSATYDYSYTMGDGDTATGSFTGDQVGGYVENVSNITLSINGTAINEPFYLHTTSPGGPLVSGGDIFFSGSLNNFLIGDNTNVYAYSPYIFSMEQGYSDYFGQITVGPSSVLLEDDTDANLGQNPPPGYVQGQNGDYYVSTLDQETLNANNWSLTLAPVPEPSTMTLAGLGALSLLGFRLRK